MATQFINKATSSATVAGGTVSFESNTVTSELFDINSVTLVKTQLNTLVVSGGTNSYTVLITNLSIAPVSNFNFADTIPNGMSYKTGTFKVNATTQTPTISGQDLSYVITSLPIGATTITFEVDVA